MLSNMRGAKTCFNCRLIWRPKDKRSQRDATSPVPSAKINRFVIPPNHRYNSARHHPLEGRIAIVTDVGGMRWTLTASSRARRLQGGPVLPAPRATRRRAGRAAHVADGEVVWSWHPLLVSSPRRLCGPDRAFPQNRQSAR
jgi:hypothetical protein